jgi:hypothetical protein
MSTASFSPAHRSPARGASALGADAARHRHVLGGVLRAVHVYVETAFRVAVLGEYREHSPVSRR